MTFDPVYRSTGHSFQHHVRLLPRTLHRHHVPVVPASPYPVLRLQLDHPLRLDLLSGPVDVPVAAGRGREGVPGHHCSLVPQCVLAYRGRLRTQYIAGRAFSGLV